MEEIFQELKETAEVLTKALVRLPAEVRVDVTEDEIGILVSLFVSRPDMGLLIGKQGSTVSALRTIFHSIGAKHKKKVNLKVHEPEGSTRNAGKPFGNLKDIVGDLS